jgi:hypothetical protein
MVRRYDAPWHPLLSPPFPHHRLLTCLCFPRSFPSPPYRCHEWLHMYKNRSTTRCCTHSSGGN